MHWDDARIFLAFAREGSFSAAAKRLGIQHSTISRRLKSLEKQLGAPLVQRSKTGYVLTGAGEQLKLAAYRIEQELLSFEAASTGKNSDVSGELRVTAIANMASTILMPIFASFSKAHPNIDLRIDVTNQNIRLAERDADIALRQTNNPGETLIGTRLATVASAVYGSTDYCASVRAGAAKEKWIGVDCCDHHRNWTKQACPDSDHSLWVDETALTVAALKEGLGVGYLPCFIGDADADLARFREPEKEHDIGFWLLYHRDLRNMKRVELFRQHVQREVKKIVNRFEGRLAGAS